MPKIISAEAAAELIQPGNRVSFGGFLAVGCAEKIVDALVNQGTKDLHMIAISTDYEDKGVGKLIANNQVKSVQISHMGTNKATQNQMNNGTLEVELVPQGTLMERIRAKGAGLGGILTPTGVGTIIADGKEKFIIDNKEYILEKAISADFAIIKAHKADKLGNLIYSKTARNSNPIMAMGADVTIVEVDEIVETGDISPEEIITPGIFVKYIVLGDSDGQK